MYGGLATVITLGVICFYLTLEINKILYGDNIKAKQNEFYNPWPPLLNLDERNFFFAVQLR